MEFCKEWTATHDRMPGRPATLRVEGCVCFDKDGWTAELVEHEGSPPTNMRVLMLDVVATPPDAGPEVLTEVPVRYELVTDTEFDHVHVFSRAPKIIDVKEVSRGG